tara:strand:- start:3205 stop:3444 length:240 start_codon:yes stop_codon:yes gene_type:complete
VGALLLAAVAQRARQLEGILTLRVLQVLTPLEVAAAVQVRAAALAVREVTTPVLLRAAVAAAAALTSAMYPPVLVRVAK